MSWPALWSSDGLVVVRDESDGTRSVRVGRRLVAVAPDAGPALTQEQAAAMRSAVRAG